MKKLVTISILLFSFQLATAQRLNVTTYVEKTNIGIKGGTAFGFENHLGFEYGGFYQEAELTEGLFGQERDELPRFYEKEFFGLYGAAPLMVRAKYDLKINVRHKWREFFNHAILSCQLSANEDYQCTRWNRSQIIPAYFSSRNQY